MTFAWQWFRVTIKSCHLLPAFLEINPFKGKSSKGELVKAKRGRIFEILKNSVITSLSSLVFTFLIAKHDRLRRSFSKSKRLRSDMNKVLFLNGVGKREKFSFGQSFPSLCLAKSLFACRSCAPSKTKLHSTSRRSKLHKELLTESSRWFVKYQNFWDCHLIFEKLFRFAASITLSEVLSVVCALIANLAKHQSVVLKYSEAKEQTNIVLSTEQFFVPSPNYSASQLTVVHSSPNKEKEKFFLSGRFIWINILSEIKEIFHERKLCSNRDNHSRSSHA